jgi:molybdopterin-guanine dinucleotide biosynthesis protein MobB
MLLSGGGYLDAYILTGGKGSRLGQDKTGLLVGGRNLLQHMLTVMARHFDRVCLVGGNGTAGYGMGAEWIPDGCPGLGPLGGIQAGLEHTRGTHAFFAACDLAFFRGDFAAQLAREVGAYDAVVPAYRGFLEPMCAVYGKSCLPAIKSVLARGERRVSAFFPHVRTRLVPEEVIREYGHPDVLFLNVNTPDDLAKARRLAGPHPRGCLATGDQVPVLSVVGHSQAGKTRLVVLLIQELGRRGYRVVTVKHAAGGFQFDRPGSDTQLHFSAGAAAVAAVGNGQLGLIESGNFTLSSAIARMGSCHLVLAEGFKREDWAKVEVWRTDAGPMRGDDPRLIAGVTEGTWNLDVPLFQPTEAASLAAHLELILQLQRDGM